MRDGIALESRMFEKASRPDLTYASLNRAAHLREDAEALARMRTHTDARVLPFAKREPLLTGADFAGLGWVRADNPLVAGADLIFLGLEGDAPRFAAALPETDAPEGGTFIEMRSAILSGAFGGDNAAIASGALAMVNWHSTHPRCARCGEETRMTQGGWRRDCSSCEAAHFPRTDPVVIMLLERDGHCALARNVNFPETLFSCIAGFVEPGECVEEAVRRESFEELGLTLGRVAYVSSQPWPFPMSLMMGCIAETADEAFTLEAAEIAEARWLSRDDVRRLMAGGIADMMAPRKGAIAGTLLDDWVNGRIGFG